MIKLINKQLKINSSFTFSVINDTGYPHDGRADKNSYPHVGRADKDSYPHDRHNQYIILIYNYGYRLASINYHRYI